MIYTIGETVLDIIIKNMQPIAAKAGGSAFNTAISLGQFGDKVSFVSEIGGDEPGLFCRSVLIKNNVDVSNVMSNSSHKTSLSLAFLNEHNDARYQFYKDLPDSYSCKQIPFFKNDIVLFSSSFALSERVRNKLNELLYSAQLKNSLIVYDPNMRKQLGTKSKEYTYVIENFSKTQIVRASDEDCMNIFGMINSEKIYKKLQGLGVKVLILTKNKDSVEIFTPLFYSKYDVPEIVPLSTIGAGDTFNAGVLHCLYQQNISAENVSLLSREFWDKTIPFAISCASLVCNSLENYITPADIIELKTSVWF